MDRVFTRHGGAISIVEAELPNRAGLSGGDNGACGVDGEALLDFRHGLLRGELGEAGGGILAREILGGDLLDPRCGEEGDGDGGEQRGDEQDENECASGIVGRDRGFNCGGYGGGGKRKAEGVAAGSGASRVHGAAGLVGVEGYEAAHGDGALSDEALDIRVTRGCRITAGKLSNFFSGS